MPNNKGSAFKYKQLISMQTAVFDIWLNVQLLVLLRNIKLEKKDTKMQASYLYP